ncbi:MAG: YjeE family ATPase [candidate division TM6 bacterium GW2011_GWE2_31_21]|nr:MAG: YjeE family ATPase [candidate division TM6 bacterium GW2011_GWE2_31_21]KKP54041.1 MAG: YjeE family ATPase [candidate division TM6 bacterium GW2011_GWF2_33_332]
MNKKIGLNELDSFIKNDFLSLLKKYKIFIFIGNLGAGKTTFISRLIDKCGIKEIVSSPTFNYVNIYQNSSGDVFYHFDLYRLDSLNSFLDMGFDEYLLQENSYCFIEWPEVIFALLKEKALIENICTVKFDYDLKNLEKRIISVNPLTALDQNFE